MREREAKGTSREILSKGENEEMKGTETCARSFGPTENPVFRHPADGAERLRTPFAARLARCLPSFSYLHTLAS